jgi:molybdopterin/thiamine biosynthesis adenylyltransferase
MNGDARPRTAPRPRLRDSVIVVQLTDGRLQFRATYERVVSTFSVEPWVVDLVPLLDGTRTREELAHTLSVSDEGALDDVLTVLESERFLAPETSPTDRAARHSRQLQLFDEMISADELTAVAPGHDASTIQSRLTCARVVVVGVGGAGSWVVQSLAAAGVGNLVLIDPDIVEPSNLNRQVLFDSGDIGRVKVDAAAERVAEIDARITVDVRRMRVDTSEQLAAQLSEADLVVSCADQPSVPVVADVVATACTAAGVPHIVGGAYGAQLGAPGVTVLPGRTTCWSCIRAATADDHGRAARTVKGSSPGGSVAPLAGVVGNMTAWEALRILLGAPPALTGGVREVDLATFDSVWRPIPPRDDCGCVAPVEPT